MAKLKPGQYEAAGGVVVDQGRMLLLDRPARGEIRLPKGHIDPGESAETAALREVGEESGYTDLEIIHDMGVEVVEYDYNGKHYIRTEHYFLMRLLTDRTAPRNGKDEAQFKVLWVPLEAAADSLTYEAESSRARAAVALLAAQP